MLSLATATLTAFRRDQGQDLIEYALLLTLVVMVVAAILPTLATTVIDVYYNQVVPALGG